MTKKTRIPLKTPRSISVAAQCREMGITVGDTIIGRKSFDDGDWHETKLTLLFAGAREALWKVWRRNKKQPRWKSRGESADWSLECRPWAKVVS